MNKFSLLSQSSRFLRSNRFYFSSNLYLSSSSISSSNHFLFLQNNHFSSLFSSSLIIRSSRLSTNLFLEETRAKKKKGGGKSKNSGNDDEITVTSVDLQYLEEKMNKTIDYLNNVLSSMRTETISPSLIENILVELPSKSDTSQNQEKKKTKQKQKKEKKNLVSLYSIADIAILDHRALIVHPHDENVKKHIIKALSTAEGGFTPQPHEGTGIKVPVPKMTIEFREQLEKQANKYAEESRESLRRTRREGMDQIKRIKSSISKDDAFRQEKQVKDLLDKMIKQINDRTNAKIKEIKDTQ